jgi:serine/threonine protein phosphatase PrpC
VTTTPDAVTVVDLSAASTDSLEIAAATHIGPVRNENQDAFAATPLRGGDGVAAIVADGMGGLPGGREAAAAATAAAVDALAAGEATHATMVRAVQAANTAVGVVRSQIGGQPGTTLTIAAVRGREAVIGHAGDSRAYLVRAGTATVLTRDHSWVGDQVRAGALEAGSERHHARRNIITRAVMGDDLDPEVLSFELSRGDILMLCSDGFWEPLSDDQIADLLATPGPLTAVVERAAQAALDAGATDNVTLVAVRLDA